MCIVVHIENIFFLKSSPDKNSAQEKFWEKKSATEIVTVKLECCATSDIYYRIVSEIGGQMDIIIS